METTDAEAGLVRAAQAGDKGAFAVLLGRHRPLLVALCRRMLGDPELAEDAAQEAALEALLSLTHLRRADRFGPWLGGIGLNVCRRWLRERGRAGWSWDALLGGRRIDEPIAAEPGPDERAEAAELAERVRRAVAALPPGQRAAVALYYLAGLTHAETAALLGIEVGAVKTRLHKGRAVLRRELWTLWKENEMTTRTAAEPVEMRVGDVRRQPAEGDKPQRHVVLLEEVHGERRLPIWIGPFEGAALALQLLKFAHSRPLTFSFMASLLHAAGGRLREVRISRLDGDTFYAVAVVQGPTGVVEIDARPSDALTLALTTGARISVEPVVLETAGAGDATTWAELKGKLYGPDTIGPDDILAEAQAAWATQRTGPHPPAAGTA